MKKNIMSLISRSIEEQYSAYRKNVILNFPVILFKYLSLSFSALLISSFLWIILCDTYINPNIDNYTTMMNNLDFSKNIFPENILSDILHCLICLILHSLPQIVIYLFSWGISFYLWKLILLIINTLFDSPSSIEKKIKELNERISAEINETSSTSSSINKTIEFSLSRKKDKKYPLANAREIEFELTNILKSMSTKRNLWKHPPEFIIIFDELDKIDPFINNDIPEESNILPEFEHIGNIFPGGAASRKKKNTLLKMLTNMKFFVTTANTKFIFIAGRELYDAFLADFSDREFTIGSIFSNVIYVESFLSSDLSDKDITKNTEYIICKQLFPINEMEIGDHNMFTFKNYYTQLKPHVENGDILNEERDKIIIFLYQFSVYLSHISNGAPKKIAIHFEKYIQQIERVDKSLPKDEVIHIPNIDKKNTYYLSFGYKDQQKIGFIHYMAFPLVNALINNATQYGDKLLVSACFLTNHIYKFHNNGFSWRNLENIPEILDVNKTPELREFIHTIISFLKQSHLSVTISGLYNFKFPMKITEEISIMSKLSEEVSALFNFTLDDSLSVKRLYEKNAKYYIELNKSNNKVEYEKDLHHVIAGTHHILGDLNLFDEKYNEAIFEYQCCLQNLEKFDFDNNNPHSISHILYIIRVMLKLALTHEKRRTYNSAYIVYHELISLLIKYRYIDESKYGLNYLQVIKDCESTHYWHSKTDVLYRKDNASFIKDNKDEIQENSFEKYIQPKVITKHEYNEMKLSDKEAIKFEVEGPNIISHFARQLTPTKYNLIVRLTMFEDIRLIYQAIIAKLFLLEKKGLNGITKESLDTMESEFNYLHRTVNTDDKYILSADFFRKVADILYYKNGFINTQNAKNYFTGWYIWDYNVENDIYNYCTINGFDNFESLSKLLDINYQEQSLNKNDSSNKKGIYIY